MFFKFSTILLLIVASTTCGEIAEEDKCVLSSGEKTCNEGWTGRKIKKSVFCFDCDEYSEINIRQFLCDGELSTNGNILRNTKNVCEVAPTRSPTISQPPTIPPTSNVDRFRSACMDQESNKSCQGVVYLKKKNVFATGRGLNICKWVNNSCIPIKKALEMAHKLDKNI